MIILTGELDDGHGLENHAEEDVLCFMNHRQFERLAPTLGIESALGQSTSSGTYFESHVGFDYMFIRIPAFDQQREKDFITDKIDIYFMPRRLVFLHDDGAQIKRILQAVQDSVDTAAPLESVLYQFFFVLTAHDSDKLEDIEEEIANMEDALLTNEKTEFTASISSLRKRLLVLKRYYEALLALLTDLEENRNRMISDDQLRLFHFQTSRVDRLYHAVLNLRDYVTQVREAYQAQMDISLNQTMKLFTVITAIFLPLSLIAGWYGMNLKMPEYGFIYSYPIVIGICVAVVAGCILYFKKHKWF